jgi:hypothetical protein
MLEVDPSSSDELPLPLGVDPLPPLRSAPLPLGVDLDLSRMESIHYRTSSLCRYLGPRATGAPDPGAAGLPQKPLAQRHHATAPDAVEATGLMSQPPPPALGLAAGGSAPLWIWAQRC